MDKEFVKYKTALALKELGFDEKCFYHYEYHSERLCEDKAFLIAGNGNKYYKDTNMEKSVNAPTFHQAFRFFREKYGLLHDITLTLNINDELESFYILIHKLNGLVMNEDDDIELNVKTTNKEEAESACLDKLIEIIKNK